jgi:hypothetical protein
MFWFHFKYKLSSNVISNLRHEDEKSLCHNRFLPKVEMTFQKDRIQGSFELLSVLKKMQNS